MGPRYRRLDLQLAPSGDESTLTATIDFHLRNGGLSRREISLISRATVDGTLFWLTDEEKSLVGSLAYAYQDPDAEIPAQDYEPGTVISKPWGGQLAALGVADEFSNMGIGTLLVRNMISYRRMLLNERQMPNIALVDARHAKLLRLYQRSGFRPDYQLAATLYQARDDRTYRSIERGELVPLRLTEAAVLEALRMFDFHRGDYKFSRTVAGQTQARGEIKVHFVKTLFDYDEDDIQNTIRDLTDYVIAERAWRLRNGEPE